MYFRDIYSRAVISLTQTCRQNVSYSCKIDKKMINREGKQTLLKAIKPLQKAGWAMWKLKTLAVISYENYMYSVA